MKLAPIRSANDYEQAKERFESLFGAEAGTAEADELEVLGLLLERYEQARFQIPAPSAIDAIRFRMDQEGLTPRDLQPYIGSSARVSEILSGTRQLSIDMIRALHRHLGIPAESLIESEQTPPLDAEHTLAKPALQKLNNTGLLKAGEDFVDFLKRAFGAEPALAMLRKTRTYRTNAKTDPAALQAWCAAVTLRSFEVREAPLPHTSIDLNIARQLANLSVRDISLDTLRRTLLDIGIILVIMEHLPGTYLDGAAMRRCDGSAIVAMTLRHDRIDNFWFTLLHEIAHVSLHLSSDTQVILDDLELRSAEAVEAEADRFAQQALIPDEIWQAKAKADFTVTDVFDVAKDLHIHPAIVAGRWQREYRDYRRFAKLLGHGEVRGRLFSAID